MARMHILHCCTRCRFGTGAILRVPSLKDLPPAQLCEQCRCTVDFGAIGSGASTQQHIKSCLIVWEGGRVSSLQKLVFSADASAVGVCAFDLPGIFSERKGRDHSDDAFVFESPAASAIDLPRS